MKKALLLAVGVLFVMGSASAESEDSLNCNSDVIGPGLGPLWDVDKAVDSVIASPEANAEERANEVCNAMKGNNTAGARRALNAVEQVAQNFPDENPDGLNRAREVLEGVYNNKTQSAQGIGVNNAINNIKAIQDGRKVNPPINGGPIH